MTRQRQLSVSWTRACLALLMLALFGGVQALVASERLHEHLHEDAQAPEHRCAVTLFHHGLVDAAAPALVVPAPVVLPAMAVCLPEPVVVAVEHRLPPGRAPPSSR